MKRQQPTKRPRTFRQVIQRMRRSWRNPAMIDVRDVLRTMCDEGARIEIQLISARTLTGTIEHVGEVVIVDDKRHGHVVFPLGAIASIMREPKR